MQPDNLPRNKFKSLRYFPTNDPGASDQSAELMESASMETENQGRLAGSESKETDQFNKPESRTSAYKFGEIKYTKVNVMK